MPQPALAVMYESGGTPAPAFALITSKLTRQRDTREGAGCLQTAPRPVFSKPWRARVSVSVCAAQLGVRRGARCSRVCAGRWRRVCVHTRVSRVPACGDTLVGLRWVGVGVGECFVFLLGAGGCVGAGVCVGTHVCIRARVGIGICMCIGTCVCIRAYVHEDIHVHQDTCAHQGMHVHWDMRVHQGTCAWGDTCASGHVCALGHVCVRARVCIAICMRIAICMCIGTCVCIRAHVDEDTHVHQDMRVSPELCTATHRDQRGPENPPAPLPAGRGKQDAAPAMVPACPRPQSPCARAVTDASIRRKAPKIDALNAGGRG